MLLKGAGSNRYWRNIKDVYLQHGKLSNVFVGDVVLLRKSSPINFEYKVVGMNTFTQAFLVKGASNLYLKKSQDIRSVLYPDGRGSHIQRG